MHDRGCEEEGGCARVRRTSVSVRAFVYVCVYVRASELGRVGEAEAVVGVRHSV